MGKNIPIILTLFVASACSTMVPLQQQDHFNPATVASLETPQISIYLEHLQNQYNHYVFDLEIVNASADSIYFSPQAISYYASPRMFDEPKEGEDVHSTSYQHSQLLTKRIYARTPTVMQGIFTQRERELQAARTFLLLVSAGAIIYDAVKDGHDYRKEVFTQRDANRANGRDALVASSLILADASGAALAEAHEEEHYVSQEIFPEGIIPAGGRQRGKVFLPVESFRYTRLVIPIGQTDYVLDFKRRSAKGK